jgi:hypothetical protein
MKHRGAAGNIQKITLERKNFLPRPGPTHDNSLEAPRHPAQDPGRLCGREPPFTTTATDPKHA